MKPEQEASQKNRGGRPPDPDKLHFKTVGLRSREWEWLETWNEHGNITGQLSELIERGMKVWPKGAFSVPQCPPEARTGPNTKLSLRRRIRDLEEQLRKAGIEVPKQAR